MSAQTETLDPLEAAAMAEEEANPETPVEPETEPEPVQLPEDAPEPEPNDEPTVEDDPDEGDEQARRTENASRELTEKEIEKRQQALEREAARHEKRVQEILGADADDLVKCEACPPSIPGYHYPAEQYAPGDPSRALYEMLSGGADVQMTHPARYETCQMCNGHGKVLSGALNEIHRMLVCPECNGDGYHDTQEVRAPVAVIPTAPTLEQAVAESPIADVDRDLMGRPAGHPNYSKYPIYMTDADLEVDRQNPWTIPAH